jgi:hypothetical protein
MFTLNLVVPSHHNSSRHPEYHSSWQIAAMQEVSWQAFNKIDLPGRDFTLWQWFYAAVDLIHKVCGAESVF